MRNHRRGLVCGLIVVFALALAACSGGSGGLTDGKGQIRIVMSSGTGTTAAAAPGVAGVASPACEQPEQSLQAANVTFSSILARTLDGKLIDVTIELPVTMDLLSLGGGNEATLPIGFLPPGTYDQLVVVITQLEVVLRDGTQIAVTPPGGGWTAIVRVTEPFTVVEGQTTTVKIRFRRDLSFGCGDGGWRFHPEFDCDQDQND